MKLSNLAHLPPGTVRVGCLAVLVWNEKERLQKQIGQPYPLQPCSAHGKKGRKKTDGWMEQSQFGGAATEFDSQLAVSCKIRCSPAVPTRGFSGEGCGGEPP